MASGIVSHRVIEVVPAGVRISHNRHGPPDEDFIRIATFQIIHSRNITICISIRINVAEFHGKSIKSVEITPDIGSKFTDLLLPGGVAPVLEIPVMPVVFGVLSVQAI